MKSLLQILYGALKLCFDMIGLYTSKSCALRCTVVCDIARSWITVRRVVCCRIHGLPSPFSSHPTPSRPSAALLCLHPLLHCVKLSRFFWTHNFVFPRTNLHAYALSTLDTAVYCQWNRNPEQEKETENTTHQTPDQLGLATAC